MKTSCSCSHQTPWPSLDLGSDKNKCKKKDEYRLTGWLAKRVHTQLLSSSPLSSSDNRSLLGLCPTAAASEPFCWNIECEWQCELLSIKSLYSAHSTLVLWNTIPQLLTWDWGSLNCPLTDSVIFLPFCFLTSLVNRHKLMSNLIKYILTQQRQQQC